MFEFGVPEEDHINIPEDVNLSLQFPLALGTIGEFAVEKICEATDSMTRQTPVEEVLFAAQVLVATIDAKVAESIESVVRLIAAAAFFLADSPGRSLAHCRSMANSSFDENDALAPALLAVLLEPWKTTRHGTALPFLARSLLRKLQSHYFGESDKGDVIKCAVALREWVYANGDQYQLLLGDLMCAVAIRRANISAWTLLPEYTAIDRQAWGDYLKRPEAIKDMWPSQQMLGISKVYAGASAVVQMPTSAGKTRATELVLRSAFKSERTSLAIVVAPFRALCYEIAQDLRVKFRPDGVHINQLSDALQQDYRIDLSDFLELGIKNAPHVVILTPEKLLYVIRQEPEFVSNVGLVIYDEGHQFDDSGRGVTYELLLTSIKLALPASAQTVLISAVISNAEQLANWLLAEKTKVVSDTSVQTSRHIAFATMAGSGSEQLQFDSVIQGEQEFFVPHLISHHKLTGDKNPKYFPTVESGSVALYLGLKLIPQGGVAIFVGKPASASKIINDAVVKILPRSKDIKAPSAWCDDEELARLVRIYTENFGEKSFLTHGAKYGLFAHTGDTPQGIRLAIEHAMRESLISLIVCTSTLAQGVNLPIRYLLVTSPYQNGRLLKTRDFQNLVGRAGRAGMYGDGTVVFTDFKIYDRDRRNSWKWSGIKGLLRPEFSAPTSSALLRLVKPLFNRYENRILAGVSERQVVEALIIGDDGVFERVADLVEMTQKNEYFSMDEVRGQLNEKSKTISSIQTFLMANQDSFDARNEVAGVQALVEETFAYHVADAAEKLLLEWAFQRIWMQIAGMKLEPEVLIRYGQSLLGLNLSQKADEWVTDNLFQLQLLDSPEEALDFVWPFIDESPVTEKLRKLEPAVARKKMVDGWIKGLSFKEITDTVLKSGGYVRWGKKRRKVTVDSIVGYCQNELSFQTCMLLSAVAASYEAIAGNAAGDVSIHFERLGKILKYGLPSEESVSVYEAGFADRMIAQAVAKILPSKTFGQDAVRRQLRRHRRESEELMFNYPHYFQTVLDSVIR